ncbi:Uncharacterised protein [Mycobacteroides abscessus subsp. abscessus]|nr:Uncharacterised protein [Mycobacteroides abscessus subsp. abscessus]
MRARGLSWRTVSTVRMAVASRSRVMMTSRALVISARRSRSRSVASPRKAARLSWLAAVTALASSSITTIFSVLMPWRSRVATALRPLVP